jgi:hypothetical protein
MMKSEYEQIHKDVVDFLERLDDEDRKFVLVDYETEEVEVKFRWEYQCESTSEADSVFRKIYPDQ